MADEVRRNQKHVDADLLFRYSKHISE